MNALTSLLFQESRRISCRLLLLLSLFISASKSIASASSSSSTPLLRSQQHGRELVIGGHDVQPDRYPYYVALVNANDETECGGTLIAPDVVLTAAHCRASNLKYALVGKYWFDSYNSEDNHERIAISNPTEDLNQLDMVNFLEAANAAIIDPTGYIHPLHNLKQRTHDVMLMKLERSSTKPSIKVNFDPTIPIQQDSGNEIVVVGMGRVDVSGPKPDILQQVYLDYIPYDQCIDSSAYNVDYKFELMPDMMCTHGVGVYTIRGQCYGDSGGPYLVLGDDPSQDLQVGVVSWAVNCASAVFPMVGSRTSSSVDFIRDVTCTISSNPPDDLCSPTPIETPIAVVENGVPVSVNVYSDPYPYEISWKITDRSKQVVYAEVPFGAITGDHLFKEVLLPPGTDFIFSIIDAADDGIFGDRDAKMYEIILLDRNVNLVLLEGDGAFTTVRQEGFRVPLASEYASLMPPPIDTDVTPTSSRNTIPVFVTIVFADYHEDLSWKITDAYDESIVFVSKGFDTYRYGKDVRERINLPPGSYHFIIRDRRGTDEYRAFESYNVKYRNTEGDMIPLFESQAAFTGVSQTHTFSIPTESGGPLSGTDGQDAVIESNGTGGNQCGLYGNACQSASDCCSGRCALNRCRESATSTGRRQRTRIGSSTRGGAAGRANRGAT